MPRALRRGTPGFGPRSLSRRLAQLLPGFPEVAVCVEFSGGADSTALLAALARLKRPPLKLRALHVDHRLHPHSSSWSAHCRRLAHALDVPLEVRTASIVRARGESLEAAARATRYRLLAAALGQDEALLTAHHEDDQLETVLLQLLRGAGLAGIAAMPAKACFARGALVRPLLSWSHAALTAWVRSQGLGWIEDPGNSELRLDRNYLRSRVLPVIRERWPSAALTVTRTAQHAAEAQRLLDALGAADAARASFGAMLSAKLLRTLSPERRRNALRFWITNAGHLAPPARRLEEIAGPLLAARADAQPLVRWEGALVQRHADLLSLRAPSGAAGVPAALARGSARSRRPAAPPAVPPAASAPRLDGFSWQWHRRRTCVLPAAGGTLTLKRDARGPVDLDALPATLTIRARAGGERLRPVRGGPRRALKSLLQEARVPIRERARLPLMFASEKLIAVAGLWLDESVQASAASRRRARLIWSAAG
ncbi:MAG TPA: tRNA lysidine(34) synthetase TilS [Steroidobacteraceae bacterium]